MMNNSELLTRNPLHHHAMELKIVAMNKFTAGANIRLEVQDSSKAMATMLITLHTGKAGFQF